MKKQQKSILILISLLLMVTVVSEFTVPTHAVGENWLSGYAYRKQITIAQDVGAGTNYQILINVFNSTAADSGNCVYIGSHGATNNFNDIKFTASDGSTAIYYWQEAVNTTTAIFWTKVTDNLDAGNGVVFMYYGKTGDTDKSNGEKTFLEFDDFNDGSLNTSKWTTILGAPAENGGYLKLSGQARVQSISTWSYATAWRSSSEWYTHAYTYEQLCGYAPYLTPLIWLGDYQTSSTGLGRSASWKTAYQIIYDWAYSSFSSAHFITLEIQRNSTTNDLFYENTTLFSTHGTEVPTANMSVGAYSDSSGAIWQNWILVRKFIYPEPTLTWAAEENSIATATFYYSDVAMLIVNGTQRGNETVTFVRSDTMNLIMAVVANYTFFNWTYDGSSSISNPFNLTITSNLTIIGYVGLLTGGGTTVITLPGETVTETVWHPLIYVAIGIAIISLAALGVEEKRKKH